MKNKISSRLVNSLQPKEKPFELVDTEIKGFLLRVQPSGVMTYYLAYRNELGKKQRYKIGKHGTITCQQARDIAKSLAGDVAKGIDIHAEKKSKVEKVKIEAARETIKTFTEGRYKEWRRLNRKRVDETITRIKAKFYQDFAECKLDEITTWDIEKWRNKRKLAGIKATTINRDLMDLKAMLTRAAEWGLIDHNPIAGVKPLKIDNSPNMRYLNSNEESHLLAALDRREKLAIEKRQSANTWRAERGYDELPKIVADRLKPLVVIAMNTGMRRGELFQLCWSDVNFQNNTITIQGDKAKSGQTRHIPMNKLVRESLAAWKKIAPLNQLVFPSDKGGKLDNIKKSFTSLLKLADIQDFRFHDLRHHFASKLVMSGVDLNTVRELLGHSDLKTTLRYAHLAPEHKQEAVDRLVC